MASLTCLFPGQGSQTKGMGKDLFARFPGYVRTADSVLGYSLEKLCLDDPDRKLSLTEFTQPAVFCINVLSFLDSRNESDFSSDSMAGHSLGEYSALFAAGAFDFETGLVLVKKRAELMAGSSGGGMAAVIGMNSMQLERFIADHPGLGIEIANYNSPLQLVISGKAENIKEASALLQQDESVKMVVPLKVSGAFHSSYMNEAAQEFGEFVSSFSFSALEYPVIANVTARPYTAESIGSLLRDQIVKPVLWTDSIRYLLAVQHSREFREFGNGKVLTGLVARIKKESDLMTISDRDLDLMVSPRQNESRNTHEREQEKSAFDAVQHAAVRPGRLTPQDFGCSEFRRRYNLDYAYISGSMYRGIASKEMVAAMGKAGMLGFLGTGGMPEEEIEEAIKFIKNQLSEGQTFGVNLLNNHSRPEAESRLVDVLLDHAVPVIEASAYLSVSPALVKYKVKGLHLQDGRLQSANKIIVKLSRPEIAAMFLAPPSEAIVRGLIDEGAISGQQASLARRVSLADDICVEADSGGHTDRGNIMALLPAIKKLVRETVRQNGYELPVHCGAAGGIGTPESALAVLLLGAEFIVTGSINQCTVEASTSDLVKDLLESMDIQDTDYVPSADMFELGAKVQVLKKGLFFAARANRLYHIYSRYASPEDIDQQTRDQIEQKYFAKDLASVLGEYRGNGAFGLPVGSQTDQGKQDLARICKHYLNRGTLAALRGDPADRMNFQIMCGPALGCFNRWVRGTDLEHWRSRHVDAIGRRILGETADLLSEHLRIYMNR